MAGYRNGQFTVNQRGYTCPTCGRVNLSPALIRDRFCLCCDINRATCTHREAPAAVEAAH